MNRQKYSYIKRTLSDDNINSLKQLRTWNAWILTNPVPINNKRSFDCMVNLCVNYEKNNKGKRITKSRQYDAINIGYWFGSQKQNHRENILSEEKITKLENINTWNLWIDETFNTDDGQYKKWISLCLEYEKEKSTNIIPQHEKHNSGAKIGGWFSNQKTKYKNNNLSQNRIDELSKLESWKEWLKTGSTITRNHIPFNDMLDICLDFEITKPGNSNGIIISSSNHKKEHIGYWYDRQKKAFRNGELPEKESLSLRKLTTWNLWLEELNNNSSLENYLRSNTKINKNFNFRTENYSKYSGNKWRDLSAFGLKLICQELKLDLMECSKKEHYQYKLREYSRMYIKENN